MPDEIQPKNTPPLSPEEQMQREIAAANEIAQFIENSAKPPEPVQVSPVDMIDGAGLPVETLENITTETELLEESVNKLRQQAAVVDRRNKARDEFRRLQTILAKEGQ